MAFSNPKRKKIRLPDRKGVVLMDEFRKAIEQLAEEAGIDIEIENTERARQVGGGAMLLKVPSSGGGEIVDTTPIWGIRSDYKITPGTIGGLIPTYGGISLSPIGSANEVPSSGNHQLWLKVTWTIAKDANGYLTSRSVNSVVIQDSEPTESESVKKLFLIECVDGVWTLPAVSGSRSAVLCNTGANETAPTFGTA